MKKIIEVKNLNYSYPNGSFKLKNINFEIFEKESVGIIGPNGAGKTTLVLNLNGILFGEGSIRILEYELNKKNLKEIRKRMQIVFQNPDDQLFSSTVYDDVAFGPRNLGLSDKEVEERVKRSLEDVEMINKINFFPEHLSFGEKKRVSIATVLSMNPEIIIFDEPTIGLDPYSKRNITRIIKNIDCTKILVSHDLDMIYELCNRVILMNDGKIVKIGEKNEILLNKKILEENSLEIPLSAYLEICLNFKI